MKIGFIGLGQMGAGMAASLLKAGHEVSVYNRTRTKADKLVTRGEGRRQRFGRLPQRCRDDHASER